MPNRWSIRDFSPNTLKTRLWIDVRAFRGFDTGWQALSGGVAGLAVGSRPERGL